MSHTSPMKSLVMMLGLACTVAFSPSGWGQQPPTDEPRYADGTRLVRPADYREWPFLGSGLGLTHEGDATGSASSRVYKCVREPIVVSGFHAEREMAKPNCVRARNRTLSH